MMFCLLLLYAALVDEENTHARTMMMLFATPLLASATAAFGGPIPAEYATNITVYHVNEHSFGAIPVNMNTHVPARPPHRRGALIAR